VRAVSGCEVHLVGYFQGGMLCYQTAAYRRNEGLASLVRFGAPVDVLGALPFGIAQPDRGSPRRPARRARPRALRLPAWASRTPLQLLDPVKALRRQIDFLLALHDREALLPRERQREFLEPAAGRLGPRSDFVEQFVAHNRMLSGGFVIGNRLVTLAGVTLPVLTVVGRPTR
jgi:putative long chain acyl-CoA synthase